MLMAGAESSLRTHQDISAGLPAAVDVNVEQGSTGGANRGRVARTPRRRVGRGRSAADRRRPERTPPRRYEQTPGGNASSPGAAALPPTSRTADGLAWPATGFRQTGRQSADVAFACR